MVARTCGNWGEGANHTLGDRCAFWLDRQRQCRHVGTPVRFVVLHDHLVTTAGIWQPRITTCTHCACRRRWSRTALSLTCAHCLRTLRDGESGHHSFPRWYSPHRTASRDTGPLRTGHLIPPTG